MEKLDYNFDDSDFIDFDDVLDHSFFASDEMEDSEEDEDDYDDSPIGYWAISEF